MSKYTIKYEKNTKAKYISQLDFLRTIGRAMRRAGIPVKYSEGFNPHPLISFAAPIAVGIESECELFITELTTDISPEDFKSALNDALPPIIRILEVKNEKMDFNEICRADYEILPENLVTPEKIEEFLALGQILIIKKTKRGMKETDIRADIFGITVKDSIIEMTLATGNTQNLKPMAVVTAMKDCLGIDLGFCRYKRVCFRDSGGHILG